MKEVKFNDIMCFLSKSREYTENGNDLEIKDDISNYKLGVFNRDEDIWITITLDDYKKSLEKMSPEHQDIIKKALSTKEGKLKILFFNGE